MKKKLLPFAIISIVASAFKADNGCFPYYPMKLGMKFEIKFYGEKDKYVGRQEETVDSVFSSGNSVRVSVASKLYDSKDKFLEEMRNGGTCENGVFLYSPGCSSFPNSLLPNQPYKIKTTYSGDMMEFPNNMAPGQPLKSGKIKVTIKMENVPGPRAMTPQTGTTEFYNGKVVCDTNITTPAGKFECLKITYDFASDGMMGSKIKTHTISWMSKNAGNVRTETYNDKGTLTNYSILTSINGN